MQSAATRGRRTAARSNRVRFASCSATSSYCPTTMRPAIHSGSPARGSAPCSAATSRMPASRRCSRRKAAAKSKTSSAMSPEEMLAAIAGITATADDGTTAHLELLLLPFNNRAHAPISLTGVLAPFRKRSRHDLGFQADIVALSAPAAKAGAARPAQARHRARLHGV